MQQLVREDLLSEDHILQFRELEKAVLDLRIIVEVIKETKIGQEIDFLPGTIEDLKAKLPHLWRLHSCLVGATNLPLSWRSCFAGKEYRGNNM